MPIQLAEKFSLPDRAVTESIAVVGRKGSGKTYTGGKLFEEFFQAGAQCVALDPVGNWWGLRLSASGKKKGLDIPVFGGEHGDLPLTPEAGKLMAQVIVGRRLSCVIDVMLFRKAERKRFVTDFAEELFNLKKRQRQPLHLFLEEARKFLPQKPFDHDEMRMLGAFEDIVRLGRNYGLGCTLLDQRPQSVNKEVLSQTEILIVHQLTGKHERDAVKGWISEKDTSDGENVLNELPNLKAGECFFWSPGLMRTFQRLQIGKKSTYDASSTPELGGAAAAAPKPLSETDLGALKEQMLAIVETAAKEDPKALRAKIAELQKACDKYNLFRGNVLEALDLPVAATDGEVFRAAGEKRREQLVPIPAPVPIEVKRGLEQVLKVLEPHFIAPAEFTRVGTTNAAAIIAGMEKRVGLAGAKNLSAVSKMPYARGAAKAPTRSPLSHARGAAESSDPPPNNLTGPEQRILDSLAWFYRIGVSSPEKTAVAFMAGYRPGGGAFNNPKARLHKAGYISAVGGRFQLTQKGHEVARAPEIAGTAEELQRAVLGRLPGPDRRILEVLIAAYPAPMAVAELAEAAGYDPKGGAFNNPKARLRTLGFADYPSPGQVVAREILFP